jgi:hypothetical protein
MTPCRRSPAGSYRVFTEGNRPRWALGDGLAYRILEFWWHLADHHDGVTVVVQFEHLGAEPHADSETGAYVRVDMDFHGEPPDTGSNSKLM